MAQEDVIKAIVQDKYGSPDVLELKDVDKPVVKEDEVLVRVRAAAVNIGDWHLLRGSLTRCVRRSGCSSQARDTGTRSGRGGRSGRRGGEAVSTW